MSSLPSSFKKGLTNFYFVTSIAIGCIYIVKTTINNRRDDQFQNEHFDNPELEANKIRPGFAESTGEFKRKSEYEGGGIAYSSRVKGDRFSGILDLSWLFGGK